MLVLIWLATFALVGFNLVDTIPAPRPIRILCSKSGPEDQTVIGKSSRINLLASRLPNWYHDSCVSSGDIATHNGDSSIALDQARSQSSQLLFQERQACAAVCGSATKSPYDTYCCVEDQYCATVNGIPGCYYSTTARSQAFPSTYSNPTDITPISSPQTIDLSSVMGGPSPTTKELSTVYSPLTITVTAPISTSQSPSAASATHTSIGSILTSSASETSETAASSTTQTSELASSSTAGSMTTNSPTSTLSSNTPLAASGLNPGDIVGIVFGVVTAIGVITGIIFGVRQWNNRAPGARAVRDVGNWFCGCGRSYRRDEIHLGQYP